MVDVILIVLIISFFAITVFSLVALLAVRRREKDREDVRSIESAINDLDNALNTALSEINKLGSVAVKEIDEKYQAMLFLYNLVLDKQKDLSEVPDGDVVTEMFERYIETHGAKLRMLSDELNEPPVGNALFGAGGGSDEDDDVGRAQDVGEALRFSLKQQPDFANPKHKKIWDMRENGRNISDIAKELGIGQGEVKLILDLADRAS